MCGDPECPACFWQPYEEPDPDEAYDRQVADELWEKESADRDNG